MTKYSNFKAFLINVKWSLFFKVNKIQEKWKNLRNRLSELIKSNSNIGVPYSQKCMEFHKLPNEKRVIDGKTINVEKFENCNVAIELIPRIDSSLRKKKKKINKRAEFKEFRKESGYHFPKTV